MWARRRPRQRSRVQEEKKRAKVAKEESWAKEQEARVKRTEGEMKLLRNQREEGTAKKTAELAHSVLTNQAGIEAARCRISLLCEEQISAFIV